MASKTKLTSRDVINKHLDEASATCRLPAFRHFSARWESRPLECEGRAKSFLSTSLKEARGLAGATFAELPASLRALERTTTTLAEKALIELTGSGLDTHSVRSLKHTIEFGGLVVVDDGGRSRGPVPCPAPRSAPRVKKAVLGAHVLICIPSAEPASTDDEEQLTLTSTPTSASCKIHVELGEESRTMTARPWTVIACTANANLVIHRPPKGQACFFALAHIFLDPASPLNLTAPEPSPVATAATAVDPGKACEAAGLEVEEAGKQASGPKAGRARANGKGKASAKTHAPTEDLEDDGDPNWEAGEEEVETARQPASKKKSSTSQATKAQEGAQGGAADDVAQPPAKKKARQTKTAAAGGADTSSSPKKPAKRKPASKKTPLQEAIGKWSSSQGRALLLVKMLKGDYKGQKPTEENLDPRDRAMLDLACSQTDNCDPSKKLLDVALAVLEIEEDKSVAYVGDVLPLQGLGTRLPVATQRKISFSVFLHAMKLSDLSRRMIVKLADCMLDHEVDGGPFLSGTGRTHVQPGKGNQGIFTSQLSVPVLLLWPPDMLYSFRPEIAHQAIGLLPFAAQREKIWDWVRVIEKSDSYEHHGGLSDAITPSTFRMILGDPASIAWAVMAAARVGNWIPSEIIDMIAEYIFFTQEPVTFDQLFNNIIRIEWKTDAIIGLMVFAVRVLPPSRCMSFYTSIICGFQYDRDGLQRVCQAIKNTSHKALAYVTDGLTLKYQTSNSKILKAWAEALTLLK